MCPQAMHPQRRVDPAGHDQLQRRRVIFHQPPQGVGAGRAGQVKIINDQNPQPVRRLKVVSQSRHHIGRHLAIKAHQLAGILAEPWLTKAMPSSLDNGRDEPGRVGVGRVAAQPRRWPLRMGGQPVGQQRSLARPRRAHHQGEPDLVSPVQLAEQSRPAQQPRYSLRGRELRGREPRAVRARPSYRCRLRHSASGPPTRLGHQRTARKHVHDYGNSLIAR